MVKISSSNMDLDKYLRICDELGEEPDPQKMPPDPADFPVEVQVAFFIFAMLADRYEGMSGTYMGKDYTTVEYLFKLYEIQDQKIVLYFMHLYDIILITHKAEAADNRRKAEERKSSGGGKNFTHSVKG